MSETQPFARAMYQGAGKPGAVGEPELWTLPATGGTEAEVTAFLAALVRLVKPPLVVECGTLRGHTAEALARATDAYGGRYIGIELDPLNAEATRARLYRHALAAPDTVRVENDLHAEFRETPGLVYVDSGDNAHRLKVLDRFMGLRVPLIALHDAAPWYGYHADAECAAEVAGYSCSYFRTPQGLMLFTLDWHRQEEIMSNKKAGKAKRQEKKAPPARRPRGNADTAPCPFCGAQVPASKASPCGERVLLTHKNEANDCRGGGARVEA